MLVGTLGSLEIMTENIGNVGRHTWIFADILFCSDDSSKERL